MEIGFANPNGIIYSDLKKQIESETSSPFEGNLEVAFIKWIFEAFETKFKTENQINSIVHGSQAYLEKGDKVDVQYRSTYENWLPTNLVIKGSTVKQYLDYIELKESRQAAENAQIASSIANEKASTSIRLAIWAMIISSVLGLASILIPIITKENTPKPPFDVKIIEDKTRVKELEQKIDKLTADYKKESDYLKNELYEAEMMIDTYENKSK